MSDQTSDAVHGKMMREIDLLNLLSKALGITYPVRRIKLDVGLDGMSHLVVESIVRNAQGQKIAALLTEEFDLEKRSETRTPLV